MREDDRILAEWVQRLDDFLLEEHDLRMYDIFICSARGEVESFLFLYVLYTNDGELSSVQIRSVYIDEEHRRKRIFSRFLDYLESISPEVYIINITNKELVTLLMLRGWHCAGTHAHTNPNVQKQRNSWKRWFPKIPWLRE